jgi:hypothetical protein
MSSFGTATRKHRSKWDTLMKTFLFLNADSCTVYQPGIHSAGAIQPLLLDRPILQPGHGDSTHTPVLYLRHP